MRAIAAALLVLACSSIGCDAVLTPVRHPLEVARTEGVPLVNPLDIDLATAREAESRVGLVGTPSDRARRLIRFFGESRSTFTYTLESKTARQAFITHSGDCFSITNLFVAYARRLGIDARYTYIRDVRHYLKDETFYASSHIAAAVIEGDSVQLMDFERPAPEQLLASYQIISDAEAIGLFNSNLVMSDLSAANLPHAERVLKFLAKAVPTLPEVESNLSVVLLRRNKVEEALALLDHAVVKYPHYAPIFTNGLVAAMRSGNEERARAFATGGDEAAKNDPVFAFAQGMRFFTQQQYGLALEYFERAHQGQNSSSPLVWSYVVRVQVARGAAKEALESFSRAWRLHPNDAHLRQLREEYPSLLEGRVN